MRVADDIDNSVLTDLLTKWLTACHTDKEWPSFTSRDWSAQLGANRVFLIVPGIQILVFKFRFRFDLIWISCQTWYIQSAKQ